MKSNYMVTKSAQSKGKMVPKLRFEDFEGGWEERKLGEVAEFFKGKGISKDDIDANGKNECIRYGELYTEYGEVIKNIKSKTNVELNNSFLSKENDVLIPSSGETSLDIATLSCVKEDNVLLGGDLNVIRLLRDYNGEFFAYYLTNFQNKNIARLAQGNSVVHLYNSHLKSLKVNVPSVKEQEKIASFLGSVDAWVENLSVQKEKLEKYKKGMMRKIFSQEVRFKGFEGVWEERRLGEVGNVIAGRTPDTTKPEYWNGTVNWFTPTEIKSKYVEESIRKISDKGSLKILPIGTLLLTSRATVGDISIATQECSTNQGFQSIIANDKNCNEFIYYWILENKKQFLRRSSGSTFPEISGPEVKKIKGFFPELLEQKKIGDYLSSLDHSIQLKQNQLIEIENYKKSLIQNLFV